MRCTRGLWRYRTPEKPSRGRRYGGGISIWLCLRYGLCLRGCIAGGVIIAGYVGHWPCVEGAAGFRRKEASGGALPSCLVVSLLAILCAETEDGFVRAISGRQCMELPTGACFVGRRVAPSSGVSRRKLKYLLSSSLGGCHAERKLHGR